MKRILFILIILLSSCAKDIVDLSCTIGGVVKDKETHQFLGNCLVTLSNGSTRTTNASGIFEFKDLEAGNYTLTFSKTGYTDASQSISLTAGKNESIAVLLKAKEDTSCSITGVVKDKESNQFIENCLVTLSNGLTRTTSASGAFEFKDLEPGNYTLTFSKTGYVDASQTISLTAGKKENISVLLKCKDPLVVSSSVLDFGDFEASKSFVLSNNSDQAITYEILNKPAWAQISQPKGTVKTGSSTSIYVVVDRSKLAYGNHSQILTINYSGRKSGTITIEIICNKIELTIPTVSIYSQAENIKQNEFTIQGDIVQTGGSEIISYGHCWSTSPNPSISNEKSDLGRTSKVGNFSTRVTNLKVYTTYYVRAYATNAQGTAYSDEIVVTTQDVANNKWDGNIEYSFAGGSGTFIDPYLIETGGQLLHIKDDNGRYYKLIGNIDLDNKNWLPIELKGTFDGNGFVISNLKITRSQNNLGLFSTLTQTGTIKNLTVQGVDIQAKNQSSVGAIVGKIEGGKILNVSLKMNTDSKIIGNGNVGGIAGYSSGSNLVSDYGEISGCRVSSVGNAVIAGNSNVGGIIGKASSKITNCQVEASLIAERSCGGIIGSMDQSLSNIVYCSFSGTITGGSELGGIAGEAGGYIHHYSIEACWSKVSIDGEDQLGGIIGYGYLINITACYSDGNIKASKSENKSGGICGDASYYPPTRVYIDYCYSTVCSTSTGFSDIGSKESIITNSTSIYKTENIVDYFKELYSEQIDKYYNLNNTWTWSGTINGKQTTVVCPKLAWE